MNRGLILYGPPASGKSTVTALLEESGEFMLFPRLKAGPGRTAGYRMVSAEELDRLRDLGDLLWENTRYGARYAVDRESLDTALRGPAIPVLHLGQPEGVDAILRTTPPGTWVVIELWADLIDTASRIGQRGDSDADERLSVWASTPQLNDVDRHLDTTQLSPPQVVRTIREMLGLPTPNIDPYSQ